MGTAVGLLSANIMEGAMVGAAGGYIAGNISEIQSCMSDGISLRGEALRGALKGSAAGAVCGAALGVDELILGDWRCDDNPNDSAPQNLK